jgi:hypothetical protein
LLSGLKNLVFHRGIHRDQRDDEKSCNEEVANDHRIADGTHRKRGCDLINDLHEQ